MIVPMNSVYRFLSLWGEIENMIFCTMIYSIINILKGEQARSNFWIYQIIISNKLDC